MLLKRMRAAVSDPSLVPTHVRNAALEHLLGLIAASGERPPSDRTPADRQLCDIACLGAAGSPDAAACAELVLRATAMAGAAPGAALDLLQSIAREPHLMSDAAKSAVQALLYSHVLPLLGSVLSWCTASPGDPSTAPLAAAALAALTLWRASGLRLRDLVASSASPAAAAASAVNDTSPPAPPSLLLHVAWALGSSHAAVLEAAVDAVEAFVPDGEEDENYPSGAAAARQTALGVLANAITAKGNGDGLDEHAERCVCRAAAAIASHTRRSSGGSKSAGTAVPLLVELLLQATLHAGKPASAICLQAWPDVLRAGHDPELVYKRLLEVLLGRSVYESEDGNDDDEAQVYREQLLADCLIPVYDVLRHTFLARLWDAALSRPAESGWQAVEAAVFCLRVVAPQVSSRALLVQKPPAATAAAARASGRPG
ncbi:unnamed protein product, partial [Phaeothamnion confervicola]